MSFNKSGMDRVFEPNGVFDDYFNGKLQNEICKTSMEIQELICNKKPVDKKLLKKVKILKLIGEKVFELKLIQ